MAVSKSTFDNATSLVIDQLEGGYYHPDMLSDGRITDSRYSGSGETMFGLDRTNGAQLSSDPNWNKFWSLIDQSGARDSWPWNYMGGSYNTQLKSYAEDIMYTWYNTLSNQYLSAGARAIVESTPGLLFNFIYAAWNGAGWFKTFATTINNAVAGGNTDPTSLTQIAINARTGSSNSLIAQTGAKIAQIIKSLPAMAAANSSKALGVLLFVGFGVGAWLYFRE